MYQKKAQEKLNRLNELMQEHIKELEAADVDFHNKIIELKSVQEKEYYNDIRNRITKARKSGDRETINNIIEEIRNKNLTL